MIDMMENLSKNQLDVQAAVKALNDSNITHTKTVDKLINKLQEHTSVEVERWNLIMKAFFMLLRWVVFPLLVLLGIIALGEKHAGTINEIVKRLPL